MSKASGVVAGFGISLAIAVCAYVARETLWHLGKSYWLVLGMLGLTHVIFTSVAVVKLSASPWHRLGFVVILIVGQLWLIQGIAMQVIWHFGRFAP